LAAELLARGERVVLLTDARSSAAKSAVFQRCEIHVVPSAGVAGHSFARALRGAWAIMKGAWLARRILAPLAPSIVVGFGGYPSVAPMLAARSLGHRPVLILHDQNAVLGKANALLARICDRIALSFAATEGLPKARQGVLTGNPVRPAIVARASAPYAAPTGRINLFVFGGSLGATAFATLIPAALMLLPDELRKRIDLTMQCPASVLEQARPALVAAGLTPVLAPFFENMAELLGNAHLVVSRSGGSTVAELAVVGRPAILIPLRINEDQRANALALVAAGGAVHVPQSEGATALAVAMEKLLNDPGRLVTMAAAAGRMGITDAAVRLAAMVKDAASAADISGVRA
jgi:UDP-N-acetylglucosamine--N-acetylmuramyl-(pentapeptide) pyrophosphoryl-undecaprenol N-acetylglucosamine transferase